MRVAVVGSGISGLAAAEALSAHAAVTLYEADTRLGGHSHTVDVTLPDATGKPVTHGVDTGFLVFNHRTYPHLVALLQRLNVVTADADMSFSVQAQGVAGSAALEWSGHDLNTVFAQRSNLLRPRFWGMLADILRFNRLCTQLAQAGSCDATMQTLERFLVQHRFGQAFRDGYLLPMLACIWSCPTDQMLQFPVATMIRFCHNHGLLQVNDRPQWKTVVGGSRVYVQRLAAAIADIRLGTPVQAVRRTPHGVQVITAQRAEHFDHVVLATHSDQSLALLDAPTNIEHALLRAIRYQHNDAVLHTDERLLPTRRLAWAAWNYESAGPSPAPGAGPGSRRVCLHYLLNTLQPLPFRQPVIVTLNPVREPAAHTVHARIAYAHPVFDAAAILAQRELHRIQGVGGVWYCGAWTGYGFHEDGLTSGLEVARRIQAAPPPVRADHRTAEPELVS